MADTNPDRPLDAAEWSQKLVGKKIADADDPSAASTEHVKRSELPAKHRVLKPGAMMTRDFMRERLNVHVDEGGVCTHCYYG
ncbi:hypothetical protein EX30DRAFT_368798 [Ascodesmis nigricans]|uniref:Uncharacterized protein n=1 Tax=Ascodesmis nigricans TaxID=341454 RepID=A0A4S2N8K3_9PEZI|nr:hypothetical protein EX30DRAFT_368798 [Ascodesmis nigricans]